MEKGGAQNLEYKKAAECRYKKKRKRQSASLTIGWTFESQTTKNGGARLSDYVKSL